MSKQPDKSGEQRAAESEVQGFRKDLDPFVVAADTTRMLAVFSNAKAPDKPIIFVNQTFLDLTRYAEREVLGQRFDSLTLPGDPDAAKAVQARGARRGPRDAAGRRDA